jgi:hypothetical protein
MTIFKKTIAKANAYRMITVPVFRLLNNLSKVMESVREVMKWARNRFIKVLDENVDFKREILNDKV